MRTTLLPRVLRHVARHALWARGARVVVALSGGADSVALLLVLRQLAERGDVTLAGAAHLNHRLRDEADVDERFCRTLCARLDVPLVVGSAPVAELARAARCSVEVAGRRARYAFLDDARRTLEARHVAVAHTADDQAETVLLRLLRGAGTRGLRGVLPVRGAIVRPLLTCTHTELRAWLAALGEAWREDASNRDLANPRNRVRHELLPLLAERYQAAVVRVLARTADVADAEDALLERFAAEGAARVTSGGPTDLTLRPSGLAALPLAIARRVVRRALEAAGARRAPDLADVEQVLAVCRGPAPRAVEAAGLRVERFSSDAVLLIRESPPPPAVTLSARTLPVPGEATLPELGPGCRLMAEWPITRGDHIEGRALRVSLRGSVPGPLVVRGRQPGDRIRPAGLDGSKKLQDLLVDRKVPRRERDRVPLVVDATGRILWVIGHAVDTEASATAAGDDVIVLTFEPPVVPGSEVS